MQTLKEINNLDDQAFRDGKLIPNNTQVRFLVFVQKDSLKDAIGDVIPRIQAMNHLGSCSPLPVGYTNVPGQPGKCYPAWEDSLSSCLKKRSCDPLIVRLALGKMVVVGDTVDYLQRIVVDASVTSQEVPAPQKAQGVQSPVTHAAPSITDITPNPSAVGTTVTINGNGFGSAEGSVAFGDVKAENSISWGDTKIVIKVPVGAKNGEVVVVADGVKSAGKAFSVQ